MKTPRTLTDAVEELEGAVFDLVYAVAFPVVKWWVWHGLRRPELYAELEEWQEVRSTA